jgi:hypothetical protein
VRGADGAGGAGGASDSLRSMVCWLLADSYCPFSVHKVPRK